MGAIGSFGGNVTSVGSKATPVVVNLSLTLANTEYSQAFPGGTKSITMRCRGVGLIQYAWISTESGSNFMTIYPGEVREFEDLNATITLYVQSPSSAQVLEIEYWT